VALHVTLHALGVGPGDEVLVPDLTVAATAHAVLLTGAAPVLVDVDPATWCMDPAAALRALGPRTRAILPVHLYGQPADMTALAAVARRAGVPLVEDAAEAHGAVWAGQRVGSLGRAATFSFYGNKVITTGEGGMITTDDDALAERIRFLKDHGMSRERRYFHTELAFNYRMTNLQAALGVAQLERIGWLVARKRLIHSWYRELLGGAGAGAGADPGLALNPTVPRARSVYWMTSVLLPEGAPREEVAARLRTQGVDSRPFFVPMSALPHLAPHRTVNADGEGACPVAADLSRRGLNLPSGCALGREEVERVAGSLLETLAALEQQQGERGAAAP
jgi:perosamine synthetase